MYVGCMRREHDAAVDEAGGDGDHPGRGVIKNVQVVGMKAWCVVARACEHRET